MVAALPPAAPPASSGDWRPAVYEHVRHRIAAHPVFAVDGQKIARTVCDWTVYADPAARGGPQEWMTWPRCPECTP